MAFNRPWLLTAVAWLFIVNGCLTALYATVFTTVVVTDVLRRTGGGPIQVMIFLGVLGLLFGLAFVLSGRSLLRGSPLGVVRLGVVCLLLAGLAGTRLVVADAPLAAFWPVAYCLLFAVSSRVQDLSSSRQWLRALYQERSVQPAT